MWTGEVAADGTQQTEFLEFHVDYHGIGSGTYYLDVDNGNSTRQLQSTTSDGYPIYVINNEEFMVDTSPGDHDFKFDYPLHGGGSIEGDWKAYVNQDGLKQDCPYQFSVLQHSYQSGVYLLKLKGRYTTQYLKDFRIDGDKNQKIYANFIDDKRFKISIISLDNNQPIDSGFSFKYIPYTETSSQKNITVSDEENKLPCIPLAFPPTHSQDWTGKVNADSLQQNYPYYFRVVEHHRNSGIYLLEFLSKNHPFKNLKNFRTCENLPTDFITFHLTQEIKILGLILHPDEVQKLRDRDIIQLKEEEKKIFKDKTEDDFCGSLYPVPKESNAWELLGKYSLKLKKNTVRITYKEPKTIVKVITKREGVPKDLGFLFDYGNGDPESK
jgi:hypothetical protein